MCESLYTDLHASMSGTHRPAWPSKVKKTRECYVWGCIRHIDADEVVTSADADVVEVELVADLEELCRRAVERVELIPVVDSVTSWSVWVVVGNTAPL